MNVQHIYPETDMMISRHVTMLEEPSRNEDDGKQKAEAAPPDIIHVHGCWNYSIVRKAMKAHRQGIRIVISPHGGLEPWVLNERRLTEKLSKTLLWQRRMVESAYVVIAQSPIEADNLHALGWNPRIETIRNAVVTNSITPEAMIIQTHEVYRKVMDSHTLALMDDNTRQVLAVLLKAGITGDSRWVAGNDNCLQSITTDSWRKLLIYAEHENVIGTVVRGATVMGIILPNIDTKHIKSYLPTGYQRPTTSAIGMVERIEEMNAGPFTLLQLVELDKALRRDDVNDEQLCAALEEKRQLKFFKSVLQVLKEQTLIDEGFLPDEPLDDQQAQTLRNFLQNHLRI